MKVKSSELRKFAKNASPILLRNEGKFITVCLLTREFSRHSSHSLLSSTCSQNFPFELCPESVYSNPKSDSLFAYDQYRCYRPIPKSFLFASVFATNVLYVYLVYIVEPLDNWWIANRNGFGNKLSWRDWGNLEISWVRIFCVPAEIPTGRLWNSSQLHQSARFPEDIIFSWCEKRSSTFLQNTRWNHKGVWMA
jgi:hypothetical protein